ncbi:MAG: hypothetical protein GTO22_26660 [Gemmatimonadales bacterium]|nr:hypothetical protein [Gemmatimonadales bacterium]
MPTANLRSTVDQRTGRKIIRADRTLRTLTVIGIAVAVFVGVIAIVYTESFLRDMRELAQVSPREAAERVGLVLRVVTTTAAVVPIAVGIYLIRVALLTWRAGEFPPPGTRVLRDTTVTTGPNTRRWAVFTFIVAVMLLLSGIAVTLVIWDLVADLLRSGTDTVGV